MAEPTIHDVARRAGVSKSLVSLVLRGSDRVSPERRALVLQAARDLHYRPNAAARSLVQRRSHTIGVLLSDLHNPFFPEIVDGMRAALDGSGYRMLIATGDRSPASEAEAVESMLQLRIDGLILMGPLLSSRSITETARAVPTVVVAGQRSLPSADTVVNDDFLGAQIAIDHLAGLGHKRVGIIDGEPGVTARRRRRGHEAALRRHGLLRRAAFTPGGFTEADGHAGATALLARPQRPTAIVAGNDLAALGALSALDEASCRVPQDVSLIGYDNVFLAALRHLSLSTIDQPRWEMGRHAVQLLEERIAGRERARRITLPPTLIARDTTAPPGACLRGAAGTDRPSGA